MKEQINMLTERMEIKERNLEDMVKIFQNLIDYIGRRYKSKKRF